MFHVKVMFILLWSVAHIQTNRIFNVQGDVSVSVILNKDNCKNCSDGLTQNERTLINSAIWTVERVNFLQILKPLKFGLSIYESNREVDILKSLLESYDSDTCLGAVFLQEIGDKANKFSTLLQLSTKRKLPTDRFLVRAAVNFLIFIGRTYNITLLTTKEEVVDLFYYESRRNNICLDECYIFPDKRSMTTMNISEGHQLVIFGTATDIDEFLDNDTIPNKLLIVPLDEELPIGLPAESLIILPPQTSSENFNTTNNMFATPSLIEIAHPLLTYAIETGNFLNTNCYNTTDKVRCLKENPNSLFHQYPLLTPEDILEILKIETLAPNFVYDIFEVVESVHSNYTVNSIRKTYSYNIFHENVTFKRDEFGSFIASEDRVVFSQHMCPHEVKIIRSSNEINLIKNFKFQFRSDSWIYAFLSISLLGILFCIAIFVFLVIVVCQKRVLEGHPCMTLMLLFAVILIFCSVLPFGIEPTVKSHKTLCQIKAISVTLSYSALLALMLARSIVLSSAAKEIGFMSHIAGPVQSFLSLFIFGVQAALSLQVLDKCNGMFIQNFDFIYLMSYNLLLLIILLCLCPLIYKSQRNYRESKYFTIALVLIAGLWCIWLPCFALLCKEWKEMMVCLGLVGTGGICLGTIFIPRTYLMTIAAEREKITSALPSLPTSTSALDIYRAHSQPIYDCINVAAINAAAVARAGVIPSAPAALTNSVQRPDLYSCPALPEDLDFELCNSMTEMDKVTRF
ncbi:hypothetical protein ABEB36_010558 [Hypothenemus hampei]|uniref:G-protein coupled receptors family 3 profile domain-containing protein n=1 Tax=Hypothenemus hampei TaxID=57062 RepID=A0ABD1EK59_HYPHA